MKKKTNAYRNIMLISQLGINVLVPVFMCLFIGLWLDAKFSTWFTIPLLILGFLAGGRNAYIMAMESIKKDEKDKRK
ncbi:MAG: AtpZ/AtpI family protein [Lachnospiraceae bacterium]|nr:AtpZ/AtpI family protein [Lachnospiraceae bacterium]